MLAGAELKKWMDDPEFRSGANIFSLVRQQTIVETAVLWDQTEVHVSQRIFSFTSWNKIMSMTTKKTHFSRKGCSPRLFPLVAVHVSSLGYFASTATLVFRGYTYCWWKKSCTSWYGWYTIIYRVLYIPGGAGFLPSTVCIHLYCHLCISVFIYFFTILLKTPNFSLSIEQEALEKKWHSVLTFVFIGWRPLFGVPPYVSVS